MKMRRRGSRAFNRHGMKNRELYMNQLVKYIDTPVIKIITGIRRSGKSYLMRLIVEELKRRGVETCRIITLDFESLSLNEYRDYLSLYKYVLKKVEKVNGKIYILIDEIQEVTEWEKAVRSFKADFDCDIYLTGSNANLLSKELATYLSGRYVEFQLYPLSFNEYMDFYSTEDDKNSVEDAFYSFIRYGGFPGLYHMPDDDEVKNQYIKGIYNTVVLKDVVQRNKIRDVELLERIFYYIMDNVGQIFSAKKVADYLKNQGRKVSVESVYSHIRALENALVIHAAKRYDLKGKKVLERMEKYFLSDLGFKNAVLGYRAMDISQLLENIIYLELRRRGYDVYVGKEGDREVDFIGIKRDEKIYIQVSYLLASDKTIEREYKPLLSIRDNFRKYVLSLDKMQSDNYEGIKWVNLIEFLMIDNWQEF